MTAIAMVKKTAFQIFKDRFYNYFKRNPDLSYIFEHLEGTL